MASLEKSVSVVRAIEGNPVAEEKPSRASKKASKKAPKAETKTTTTVGRTVERSLLIVLRAVRDLGGKDVPRASIYERIATDGIGEVVGGDRLYRARKAEKALLTRTTLEGRKFIYTLTAEGKARIEAERVAEEIATSAK